MFCPFWPHCWQTDGYSFTPGLLVGFWALMVQSGNSAPPVNTGMLLQATCHPPEDLSCLFCVSLMGSALQQSILCACKNKRRHSWLRLLSPLKDLGAGSFPGPIVFAVSQVKPKMSTPEAFQVISITPGSETMCVRPSEPNLCSPQPTKFSLGGVCVSVCRLPKRSPEHRQRWEQLSPRAAPSESLV